MCQPEDNTMHVERLIGKYAHLPIVGVTMLEVEPGEGETELDLETEVLEGKTLRS